MPTKIVRTEPIIETPALFTTTETPSPAKILPTGRVMKLKMPPKKAVKIIDPPSIMKTERPAKRMKKNSKDTTKKRNTKHVMKKISDVTGLTCGQISWEPFYCNLTQEEFKIVCKNYSITERAGYDNSVRCFVCAIHPSCTHVIKKYK
jgi:hypothetical protein